jgi:hypothetical protein
MRGVVGGMTRAVRREHRLTAKQADLLAYFASRELGQHRARSLRRGQAMTASSLRKRGLMDARQDGRWFITADAMVLAERLNEARLADVRRSDAESKSSGEDLLFRRLPGSFETGKRR